MKQKLVLSALCLGIIAITGSKSLAQLDSDYQRQIPSQQLQQKKKQIFWQDVGFILRNPSFT